MKRTDPAIDSAVSRRRFITRAVGAGAAIMDTAIAGLDSHAEPAHAEPLRPAVPDTVSPLPLTSVRLTGGPLKQAQDLDAKYLLALEPNRLLAFFRVRAGLTPKAPHYGGWEGEGRNLNGHFAGHYLSALSLMYAATGDPQFKQRADYVVSELRAVQGKDGYIGALEGGHERFAAIAQGSIRSGGFDLNGMWSPWYCQHKIFAGLRDAYRHTGSRDALDAEARFAGWVSSVVSQLDDAQVQHMLATEFGGMNEVLADLAVDTGDAKYLALSDRFQHRAFLEPLLHAQDHLDGLHGNTQIPKIVGSATRHKITGNPEDAAASHFFWDAVVAHHTFATGGHGKDEYFGPPDVLSDRLDGRTAETCNVYNMLKLSRQLFAQKPDVKYADFQERALFNHILGSIAPDNGQTCYMVPVGQGVAREYQGMFTDFTCCVGTGMENHALHGSGIYFAGADKLYVNLYTPSTADWNGDVQLETRTDFPQGDSATIVVTMRRPKAFTLCLRRPAWTGDGFRVTVNGTPFLVASSLDGYVEIDRAWATGDKVEVTLSKTLHLERLADNANRAAILWGPLVLAADLGPQTENRRTAAATPALAYVADGGDITTWLKPVEDQPGRFRSHGAGRDLASPDRVSDIEFAPFYALQRRVYAAYHDIYSTADWQKRAADLAAAQAKRKALEDATIGYVQPGQMQAERDSNFQGEDSTVDHVLNRAARRGKSWFSFDVPADPGRLAVLIVTYCTAESRKRQFTVSVNGQSVGEQTIPGTRPGSPAGQFFDVAYALPPDVTHGKQAVTVRFQAVKGSEIAAIFGIRLVHADAVP